MDSSLIGIGFSLLAVLGFAGMAVLVRPALAHPIGGWGGDDSPEPDIKYVRR